MTDRWVNFNIEVTVAAEDVTVDSARGEKAEAMGRVVDALCELIEGSGFQAKYEPVLSAEWEDVCYPSVATREFQAREENDDR